MAIARNNRRLSRFPFNTSLKCWYVTPSLGATRRYDHPRRFNSTFASSRVNMSAV